MKVALLTLLLVFQARGVDIVEDHPVDGFLEIDRELPMGVCTQTRLGRDRELPIYKDFSLLGLIEIDPKLGEPVFENPLLGSFTGVVHLSRLGPPRKLKTLGTLSRTLQDGGSPVIGANSLFVPVMLCGNDSYQGSLGYLSVQALSAARRDQQAGGLPPSTQLNPVPQLPIN